MTTNDTPEPIIVGQVDPDPSEAFGWRWSQEACLAFYNGATRGVQKGSMKIGRGLSAALLVDGAALFRAQTERLITHLVTHPVLANRVMSFTATPDGKVHLTVDEALIRFVLLNELPPEVDARMAAEVAAPEPAIEGDDNFGGGPRLVRD